MKKFWLILIAISLLTGCANKNTNDNNDVNKIINDIDSIGTVDIKDVDLIENIERDYNNLTNKQKEQVSNYDVFLVARGELNVILKTEEKSTKTTTNTISTDIITTTTTSEYYDIPELTGMNFEDAKSILEEYGMIVTREDAFSDDIPENCVIKYPHRKYSQDKNKINLTVSKGKRIWIQGLLFGKVDTIQDAVQLIENEGVHTKIEYVIEDIKKYNIEDPIERIVDIVPSDVKKGDTVTIQVTKPPIKITNVQSPINSVGGVEVSFSFQNLTEKQIAYVYIDFYFYDTMGNKINCEIKNTNHVKAQITGPINAGETEECNFGAMIYNSTTGAIFPKNITIEYTDGQTQTINNQLYWQKYGYYGGDLHD